MSEKERDVKREKEEKKREERRGMCARGREWERERERVCVRKREREGKQVGETGRTLKVPGLQ